MARTQFANLNDYSFQFDDELASIYGQFFWFDSISNIEVCTDKTRQKKGIDKIVSLHNWKSYNIDDKIRKVDYGDIILEEWSNVEGKKVGWAVNTELETDYICYYISTTKKAYIFSHHDLYNYIKNNYDYVKSLRKTSTTESSMYEKGYYTTSFFPVKIKDLMRGGVEVFEFYA